MVVVLFNPVLQQYADEIRIPLPRNGAASFSVGLQGLFAFNP